MFSQSPVRSTNPAKSGLSEANVEASRLKTAEESYDLIVRTSIADGLRNLLGESAATATLYHLQFHSTIGSPKLLSEKLHSLFRDGAEIIERIIVKELFQNLALSYEDSSHFDFNSCLTRAKKMFLASPKRF